MKAFIIFILFVLGYGPSAYSQSYCSKHNLTELRAEPKLKSQILGNIKKYTPLQGTGRIEKPWIEVADMDGTLYWVNRKNISTKLNCVVVIVKQVKIRKGPGTEFDPINNTVYEKHSTFKNLGGEDGWIKVIGESGVTGWVNLDHVWKPMGKRMRMSFGTN